MKKTSTNRWWLPDQHIHARGSTDTRIKTVTSWLLIMLLLMGSSYLTSAQTINTSTIEVQEQGICASDAAPQIHLTFDLVNGSTSSQYWTSATQFSLVSPAPAGVSIISSSTTGGVAFSNSANGTTNVQLLIAVPAGNASTLNLSFSFEAIDASHTTPISASAAATINYYVPNNTTSGLARISDYCQNTSVNTTPMQIEFTSSSYTSATPTTMVSPYAGPHNYEYAISGASSATGTMTTTAANVGTPADLPLTLNAGDHLLSITKITDVAGCINDGSIRALRDPSITFTVLEIPDPADNFAGADASVCINTALALAAEDPSAYISGSSGATGGATGAWTIVTEPSAGAGTVAGPTAYNSDFTGTVAGDYTLKWTVTNGACTSEDEVTIHVSVAPVATISNANPTEICLGSTVTLDGNDPATVESTAVGTWTIDAVAGTNATGTVAGSTLTGGSAAAPENSYDAVFTPDGSGEYTLTWTVSNGDCTPDATAMIVIKVNDTLVAAGDDMFVCSGDAINLSGNDPSMLYSINGPATGEWTTVIDPSGSLASTLGGSPTQMLSPMPATPGEYKFKWEITNNMTTGSCVKSDEVSVFVQPAPDAGTDQQICSDATATLAADALAPEGGATAVGTWTVESVSGSGIGTIGVSGTFAPDANDPAATFTPDGYGLYTLRWTVEYTDPSSNVICSPAKFDEVMIDVLEKPVVDAYVGGTTYAPFCEGSSIPLLDGTDPTGFYAGGGSAPVAGTNTSTGLWTSSNASGIFTDATAYNTDYSSSTPGVEQLTWTITTTDGATVCATPDVVDQIIRATPTATIVTPDPASPFYMCYDLATALEANDPALIDDADADDGNSKGWWSIVSGPNLDTAAQFSGTSTSYMASFKPDYAANYASLKGAEQTYVLQWNVENQPCVTATTQVTIKVYPILEAHITGASTANICNGGGVTVNVNKPAALDGPFTGLLYISTTSPAGVTSSQPFTANATAGSSTMTINLPSSAVPNSGTGTVTYDISWGADNTEGTLNDPNCEVNHDNLTGTVSVTISPIPNGEITSTSITEACADAAGSPSVITFTALAGVAPYTFYYDIYVDGVQTATDQTVATVGGASTATVQQPTTTAGTYEYVLTKIGAAGCDATIAGQNSQIVIYPAANPAPVAGTNFTGGIANNTFTFIPTTPTYPSFTEWYSIDGGITWSDDPADASFAGVADKCDGYDLMTKYGLTAAFGDWAADSSASCTESASTNVLVDATAPSATVTDITLEPQSSCDSLIADPLVDLGVPTTSDNCKVVSVTNNYTTMTAATGGALTGSYTNAGGTGDTTWVITWTITDTAGNTFDVDQNVIIKDVVAPIATAPTDVTLELISQCDTTMNMSDINPSGTLTSTDECGVDALTIGYAVYDDQGAPASSPYAVGVYDVKWAIADVNGNVSDSVTQVVTVVDNTAPTWVTNPADLTLGASPDECELLLSDLIDSLADATKFTAPTADDNCIYTITCDTATAGPYTVGAPVTVTWTVTDASGNSVDVTHNITVMDYQAPALVAPADTFLDADGGDCGRVLTIADLNGATNSSLLDTTDNCGIDASTLTISPTYLSVGVNQTVTWSVEDIHGNLTTGTQMVSINDAEHPILVAPADITLDADAGTCTRVLTIADLGGLGAADTADNCSIDQMSLTISPTVLPVGANQTVTWTIEDIHDNVTTGTQLVTIEDNVAPVATAPADITLDVVADCSATLDMTTLDPSSAFSATDPCGVDMSTTAIVIKDGTGAVATAPYTVGTYTVEWTVEDNNGNVSVPVIQTVTVEDNTIPVITVVPDDITMNLVLGCDTSIDSATIDPLGQFTATDNCDVDLGTVMLVVKDGTGAVATPPYTVGVYTVEWTVDDVNGKTSAIATQTVTIIDTTKPMLVSPGDQTISPGAGCMITMPDYTSMFTPTDNCSSGADLTVVQLAPNTPGQTIISYGGSRTIVVQATDQYGNVSVDSLHLDIIDATPPTVVCKGTYDVYLDANGQATINAADLDNGSTDNCDPSLTFTVDVSSFDCSNLGNNTVTLTAEDNDANTASCTSTVVVIDTLAPVITCNGDMTFSKNSQCTFTLPDLTTNYTGSDNCTAAADLIVTQSPVAGTIIAANASMVPVTLTVEDLEGNSSECTFNTFYIDDTAPDVVGVPADITENTSSHGGSCSIPITWTPPTATDNCSPLNPGDITVTSTHNPGDLFTSGTTTVEYTFTDTAGNANMVSFDVTIIDDSAPTDTNTVALWMGECSVTVPVPYAYDSCDGSWIAGSLQSGLATRDFTNSVEGVAYGVTWSFTDAAGNVSTKNQTLVLNDVTAPTPDVASLPDVTGACEVTSLTPPTATDNCTTSTITVTNDATLPINTQGTTVVTWTYDDGNGNTSTQTQNVIISDVTAPTLAACPTTMNVSPNNTGCTYQTTINAPTVTDDCTISTPVLTWTMTGAVTASGSGAIGLYDFPVGTTTVEYTATDAGGNAATCSFDVVVTNTMNATIAGSITATQHASTTSTVTFTGNGGVSPYTFTYTTDGGATTSTVTTAPGDNVVTVAQSNQYVGTYTYEILSVSDANGCGGAIPTAPNNVATITVVSSSVSLLDFTPSIPAPINNTFPVGTSKEGYFRIGNLSTQNSGGTVKLVIAKPSNFNFAIPPTMTTASGVAVDNANWTYTSFAGGAIILMESVNNPAINASSDIAIGFTLEAVGTTQTEGNLNVTISSGTGGSNSTNGDQNGLNDVQIKTFYIN